MPMSGQFQTLAQGLGSASVTPTYPIVTPDRRAASRSASRLKSPRSSLPANAVVSYPIETFPQSSHTFRSMPAEVAETTLSCVHAVFGRDLRKIKVSPLVLNPDPYSHRFPPAQEPYSANLAGVRCVIPWRETQESPGDESHHQRANHYRQLVA